MSELVYRRPCEHGRKFEHVVNPCSGPCLIPQDHDYCHGGVEIVLDPQQVVGRWWPSGAYEWVVSVGEFLDALEEELRGGGEGES